MTLRAGTAIRDISPMEPMFLVGYPHVPRTSTGIHDPLMATALCLKNDDATLIMVAVDILFIDPPTALELRTTIAHTLGIPDQNIFISCTHTHSGPITMEMISWQNDPVVPKPDPKYMEHFRSGIIDAAVESARKALAPAELAWTTAQAEGVGGNRLAGGGVADPEVGILVVRNAASHEIISTSLIYSMHPTVLHEDSTLISGDFPAFTREYIVDEMNGDFPVLYHTGPAGNQSPRNSVRAQTFDEAQRLGELLGKSAVAAIRQLQNSDYSANSPLSAALTHVILPRRRLPSPDDAERNLAHCLAEFECLKNENAGHGPVRTAECAVFGAEETVVLARCQESGELDARMQTYNPATVQVLRIADTFLVGLPGELFVEYSLKIKAGAAARVFVVSLVNGELQGYIVTPEAALEGGYEATNSLFEPRSGDLLAEAALNLSRCLSQ